MINSFAHARYDLSVQHEVDGTYVNAALGASFSIKDDILTDPEGVHRRLSPKTSTEFFIEGLPEILYFLGDNTVKLCGQQIIPQWSETGTVYKGERNQE